MPKKCDKIDYIGLSPVKTCQDMCISPLSTTVYYVWDLDSLGFGGQGPWSKFNKTRLCRQYFLPVHWGFGPQPPHTSLKGIKGPKDGSLEGSRVRTNSLCSHVAPRNGMFILRRKGLYIFNPLADIFAGRLHLYIWVGLLKFMCPGLTLRWALKIISGFNSLIRGGDIPGAKLKGFKITKGQKLRSFPHVAWDIVGCNQENRVGQSRTGDQKDDSMDRFRENLQETIFPLIQSIEW